LLIKRTLFLLLQLSDAVRDAKLGLLKELKADQPEEAAAAEELIAQLLAEAPSHLPLLLEIMKRCENKKNVLLCS
jgi:hypothetical protein